MQIVIDLTDEMYQAVKDGTWCGNELWYSALKNGTPLPKGHGRLIDADALEEKMCDREEELGDDKALWESSAVSTALDMFAPTIIEAESEDKA